MAIRADSDALPIKEERNVDYKSKNEGVMHACGHDGHIAMALGLAKKVLEQKNNDEKINNNLRLIFQPSEEKPPGGAKTMIKNSVLNNVNYVLCIHLWGELPAHTLGIRKEFFLANVCDFELEFAGFGGHHSTPHKTKNPITMAAEFVFFIRNSIYTSVDPLEPWVIDFGGIGSNNVKNNLVFEAKNTVPNKVKLVGTMRAVSDNAFEKIKKVIKNDISNLHKKYDISEFSLPKILDVYPSIYNDPVLTQNIWEILKDKFQLKNVSPNLAADDFAFYGRSSKKIKACYMQLGIYNKKKGILYPNHHPKFDIDEDVLFTGIDAYYELIKKLN
ncbi:hypothetical protein B6U93_00010 [Candidatus Woesearchaeota archaeon ex4484_78]|nr:MAG: hypothetical protein B6U93_00010 [Candidatus Woesearchaeota archaeon ex4484_78]